MKLQQKMDIKYQWIFNNVQLLTKHISHWAISSYIKVLDTNKQYGKLKDLNIKTPNASYA